MFGHKAQTVPTYRVFLTTSIGDSYQYRRASTGDTAAREAREAFIASHPGVKVTSVNARRCD